MVRIMWKFFRILFSFGLLIASCSSPQSRDKISFKVPLVEIRDSLKMLDSLLRSYKDFYYDIDNPNILYIGTNKIGKIDSSFLSHVKTNPLIYSNNDLRIFSLILFLNTNEIKSCFKLTELGILVHDYKSTKEDNFKDIRYIVLEDKVDVNSWIFKHSYTTLDQKDGLVLIAPIDKR